MSNHTYLSRKQAVDLVGGAAVAEADAQGCGITGRVVPGDGRIEFASSVDATLITGPDAGDAVQLVAYYYQPCDAVESCDDLSSLDWTVAHYAVIG